MTVPTAEQQVTFLTTFERLAGGTFTSSYKQALLLALADLSVELGDEGYDRPHGDEASESVPEASASRREASRDGIGQ